MSSSFDPRTGQPAAQAEETSDSRLDLLLERAAHAASALSDASPDERRRWLYAIADALEDHRAELTVLADRETALGTTRLSAEVTRTAGQLRFYGDVAVEGSYVELTIDEALPDQGRLVRLNRPLGPVAVFGASNFPFAFSVLGNDTGSAIAAGCPVIAKAHPAHVGLSVRQAEIARAALLATGAPVGTLDLVVGFKAGLALVKAPQITAVAFTGSQRGGMALWRLANEREAVIPVFAEMGTVNPVIVTRAGAQDMAAIAAGFVGSFTLGHGQYCTKPGLMLVPAGVDAPQLVGAALRASAPAPIMLTQQIADGVIAGISDLCQAGAEIVETVTPRGKGWAAPASVLRVRADSLVPGSPLLNECFGAVALVCEYSTDDELLSALENLQPALAASIFGGNEDDPQAPALLRVLSGKVGRVAVGQWPTGVAYSWAQHHGGPWPATSTPSATSVGAHGLARFVRPVAFQAAPDAWLPPEAHSANPWCLPQRINGVWTPAPAPAPEQST